MQRHLDTIPLDQCLSGGIYRLHSRNLAYGVYDGRAGFIGIREKFRYRSLFTEYHYDQGAPHGTASPLELIGQLPEGVDPVAHYSRCQHCGRPTEFDASRGQTADERWYHSDDQPADHPACAASYDNEAIFAALELFEAEDAERWLASDDGQEFVQRFAYRLGRSDQQVADRIVAGDDGVHSEPGEGREVDAATYFDAQRAAGVCPGVHHFVAGEVRGAVSRRGRG